VRGREEERRGRGREESRAMRQGQVYDLLMFRIFLIPTHFPTQLHRQLSKAKHGGRSAEIQIRFSDSL
jgi:hypothetical protein